MYQSFINGKSFLSLLGLENSTCLKPVTTLKKKLFKKTQSGNDSLETSIRVKLLLEDTGTWRDLRTQKVEVDQRIPSVALDT